MAQRRKGAHLQPGYHICAAIAFTRRKLCVGHRLQDFVPVWFMPRFDDGGAIKEDDDGTVAPDYFKVATRGRASREPMPSEIHWLPYYDPAYFDARDKRDKNKKQMQFLGDAWKYLSENDPDVVRELEEELDQPNYRKWQTWFEVAKAYKQGKLRARGRRRADRTSRAKESNIPLDQVDINSDSSASEDSGYEDERPVRAGQKRARGVDADMPPPPLRDDIARREGSRSGSNGPAKKRAKPRPKSGKGKGAIGRDDHDDDQHQVSGGLPPTNGYFTNTGRSYMMAEVEEQSSASGEQSNSGVGMRYAPPTVEDLDFDDQNSTFDASTPEARPVHANGPAGNTESSLFVTPDHQLDQFDRPGGLLPHYKQVTISPNFSYGSNRTGYGAVLTAKRRSSLNRLNSRHRSPVIPTFTRGGSVLNADDRNNGGLTEEEAIEQATRASMPPSEAAVRTETNESLGRDRQGSQTEREAEQQPVSENPPVDGGQAQTAPPEEQAHQDASNELNPTAADEAGVEDLTEDN